MGVNTPVNVYLIWYGGSSTSAAWTTAMQTNIRYFFNNLGGSGWWGIMGTLTDTSNRAISTASVVVAQEYTLTRQATSVSENGIWTIVKNALSGGKLPVDPNGVYFVLTDASVRVSGSGGGGFCSSYCGWHTYNYYGTAQTPIKFSFVGNPQTLCPVTCGSSGPSGDFSDAVLTIAAHELAETVSDPQLNAWYFPSGNENADQCAWQYGTTSTAPNNKEYNVVVGTKKYLIQQNWANRQPHGYCASA